MRIKYTKTGALRFTSHRDIMRVFRRGLAAGEVPVAFSEGFNPHPRLSFGPSLRTGWESHGEYMDVMLTEPCDTMAERCNAKLPEGLRIVACEATGPGVPKLSRDIRAARYCIVLDPDNLERGISSVWDDVVGGMSKDDPLFGNVSQRLRDRFGTQSDRAGDELPRVLDIQVTSKDGDMRIDYLSTMRESKSLFPEELLEPLFGEIEALPVPAKFLREDLFVERDGQYVSPISKGVVQTT